MLEKARPNGDIVLYNPGTDEFGVVSSRGDIRTYYKPDTAVHGKGSNLDYLMPYSNQTYVCPVCRYPDLDEPAYDSFGCASYNICPCCGTEFGYDDSTTAHSDLRRKWVSEGMQWWSKHRLEPNDWDPVWQLENN